MSERDNDLKNKMNESIRKSLLDARALCEKLGGREKILEMIEEQLEIMDGVESSIIISNKRRSKLDEILENKENESEENKMD